MPPKLGAKYESGKNYRVVKIVTFYILMWNNFDMGFGSERLPQDHNNHTEVKMCV